MKDIKSKLKGDKNPDMCILKSKIWLSGKKQKDIAKELKVTYNYLSMVIHGKKKSQRIIDFIMSLEEKNN
jgi:predicted transcriptional regulator